MSVASKVLGGLVGVACGDALGATTEFEPVARTGAGRVTEIVGGGAFGWRPGEPTDDAQQTLIVAEAYVEANGDPDTIVGLVADGLVAWLDGRPRDIGATTLHALSRLRQTGDPATSGDSAEASQANGSLMRCLPTGLLGLPDEQRRAEAAAISRITHASAVCVDACIAYTDIAAALVAGALPQKALAATAARPDATDEVQEVLARPHSRPLPFAPGGWVLTALDIAVWSIQQPLDAEVLLVDIINRGSDSDTNGAIAGGLLGCRDGDVAWPAGWVARLETGDALRAAAAVLTSAHPAGATDGSR